MSHLLNMWEALFYEGFPLFFMPFRLVDRGLTKNTVVGYKRTAKPFLPVLLSFYSVNIIKI